MAGRRIQAGESDAQLRQSQFGIAIEPLDDFVEASESEEEGGQEGKATEESEESDEQTDAADASEETDDTEGEEAEAAESEEDEEPQEEDDDVPAGLKKQFAALTERVEKAEKLARHEQSRADKAEAILKNRMRQFEQNLQAAMAQQSTGGGNDEPEIGDEELIDGKTLKRLRSEDAKKQAAQTHSQRQKANMQAWVASQPDVVEVRKFVQEHGDELEEHPVMIGIDPENPREVFLAARTAWLESRTEGEEERIKAAVEKALAKERRELSKRKKPAPPTGGGNAGQGRAKGSRNSRPLNAVEQQYRDFFGSKGIPFEIIDRPR